MNIKKQISENQFHYNFMAKKYEKIHGEIFNSIEQKRLYIKLKLAYENISTNSKRKTALDYGCGTGNLTEHLVNLGYEVTSADIVKSFLKIVNKKFEKEPVSTLKINGMDLSLIKSAAYDFIGVYSVLHHIPDYLSMIREFVRCCKPGGIIYLDHECNEEYWKNNPVYEEFLSKNPIRKNKQKDWRRFFKPLHYYTTVINRYKRAKNPRFSNEGDIHVWHDDHIEWEKIIEIFHQLNVTILHIENYLVYRAHYNKMLYDTYKNKCTDMKLIIAKKNS